MWLLVHDGIKVNICLWNGQRVLAVVVIEESFLRQPLHRCMCWQYHGHPLTSFRVLGGGDINTLSPRQHGCHFADDAFKRIFLNENARISIKISLKFVPDGPINNIPALDQILAWRRPGDKPLSEPMMVRLLTHICVTRRQWVNAGSHQMGIHALFMYLNNLKQPFLKY